MNVNVDELVDRMLAGDRRALARLMTLAEHDIATAKEISQRTFTNTGKAYVIGVTGAPGSGKSSLVNQMVKIIVDRGSTVGVVAVDPSSPFSGGALLGDRIRMKENFTSEAVFIRSMANRGQLGGVARATKDVISLLDAAGFEYIIIETVGVGQAEIDIHDVASTTLLLVAPGMGDDIQAAKAGIMEICDVYVVNKMDHDGADQLVEQIESSLDLATTIELDHDASHVFTTKQVVRKTGWHPRICKTNALTGEGVEELIDVIQQHKDYLEYEGKLREKLAARYRRDILEILQEQFKVHVETALDPAKNDAIPGLFEALDAREKTPYDIAEELAKFIARMLS
jgi:LAO/AO transport system kinase